MQDALFITVSSPHRKLAVNLGPGACLPLETDGTFFCVTSGERSNKHYSSLKCFGALASSHIQSLFTAFRFYPDVDIPLMSKLCFHHIDLE